MSSTDQSNKPHRGSSGDKDKKKKKLHADGYNAKAFGVNAPRKMQRQAMRSADVKERKFHAPMVDRTPDDPPPVIVAVVGPPGTGKTTLIKSLVRRYTKNTLNEVKGPVTVVSGKRRRLTFIESNNDLNSMIDIAKCADLILLMIDGNFGLEMETMEFLNVLSPHGFPKILGVTTHLDLFKKTATMRAAKKALKHRFWTEVYDGAKLFYLSGVINGRYPDREVLNLARFISVMKFRPLKWRNEHPYVLADRMVDITHPAVKERDPKVDRNVCLYGYIHGTPMPYSNARVHIPGIGDLTVKEIERLPDPCPTPVTARQLEEQEGVKRRKRLDEKMKVIYAPMSDVGGVLIDKDAIYIDVNTNSFTSGQEKGVGERLVTSLQSSKNNVEEGEDEFKLFSDGPAIDKDDMSDEEAEEDNQDAGRQKMRAGRAHKQLNFEEYEGEESDDDQDEDRDVDQVTRSYNDSEDEMEGNGQVEFEDTDSEVDDDNEYYDDQEASDLKWKANLSENALRQFNSKRRWDLTKLIYMDGVSPDDVIKRWKGEDLEEEDIEADNDEGDEDEDDFFKKKDVVSVEEDNSQITEDIDELLSHWTEPDNVQEIKHRFYLPVRVDDEEGEDNDEEDEELYGDFEDLEASEEQKQEQEKTLEEQRAENAAKKEKMRLQIQEQEKAQGEYDAEGDDGETWHDVQKAKIAKQLEINKAEYDQMDQDTRDRIEGFRAGTYVRIMFENIACEFVENFDPVYPVLIGGLLANEDRFGFTKVNIKRHRWHKKPLKSNDPLIVSLGWRRFQTIPIYSTSDSRTRNRMLKYSKEHDFTQGQWYGPLVAPGTGFCAVQSVAEQDSTASFRIAATGTINQNDETVEIVKKLKIVGYPYKIYKNTAFIKDMFHTSLEVAKFEGAQIKTVSGIRGQIKRALAKPDGHFRATFEDKILMSDIVFFRTWTAIKPRKFYNPVTSLLLQDKVNWQGMRLTGQVRADKGIDLELSQNSQYSKFERPERRFNPQKVPRSIQGALPYGSQLAQMKPQKKQTYMQKRAVVLGGHEKEQRRMIQQVQTIAKDKDNKQRVKKTLERERRAKKLQEEEAKQQQKNRERKQEYFANQQRKRPRSDSSASRKKSKHD